METFKINRKESLSRSAVTKVFQNPYNPSQMITAYFDGLLHMWKLPKLTLEKKIPLSLGKLTAIIPFQNQKTRGFLLAIRNGQLGLVNENFQLISSRKLHKQNISEIIVSSDSIVTVGYDGQMLFLNKETLDVVKQLQFQYPLLSAVQYDNKIYVASLKSFIVCKSTYQYQETMRFNRFFIVNNRIYGTSDDRGLSCLNSNSNNYLPAEFILLFQRKIIIFSEKSICVSNQLDKLEYKAKKYAELSLGESITTGFVFEGNVYMGGNEGNIYWISEEDQVKKNVVA